MIDDGIVWTDSLRAEVIPSRRFRNDTYLRTKLKGSQHLDYPFVREQCLRPILQYAKGDRHDRARDALAKNPPAWRPAVEAAIANAHAAERGPLDVDAEVAAVTLEIYPLWAALPYWIVEAGPVFALRALIRCHEVIGFTGGYQPRHHIIERTVNGRGQITHDRWTVLRAVLAEAIEPVYDEAHGVADRARLETPHTDLALAIAYAFPEERAWARDVADRAMALAKHQTLVFYELSAYLTVAPVETAIALLETFGTVNMAYTSFATVLAHHGRDAVSVLAKAISRAQNDHYRRAYGEYLVAIPGDATARALAELAGAKPKNRVLASLVRRHARGR